MGLDFDFNVQGRYKLVTLEMNGEKSVLIILHTVEDGSADGTYWVLARRVSGCTWREIRQDGVIPRLHPNDRKRILHEENIDRMDAESIRLLCTCEAQFAEDKEENA